MADLKYTKSKGMFLLWIAAIVLCATTASAQSAKDACEPTRLSRSAAKSLQQRSSSILRWPNRWPPGEWRLSNIALRTCTLCRCSAQMRWWSRHASDTFM
jgi:hypothetical protein